MASHALKDFKCTTWRLTPVSRWRAAHACVLQAKVVINACSGVWLHTDTSKACDLTANRASWTFAVKSHAFDVSVCNQTPEQAFMTTLACHTCGVKRALNGRHTASVSGAWAARIFFGAHVNKWVYSHREQEQRVSVKQERRVSSAAAMVSAPSLFLLRCSRSNKVTAHFWWTK